MKLKNNNGFTLIEALFAALLLGLVVAALAAASGAVTMANGYGVDLSTAEFLIEEVRELTANVGFDTLKAMYDGQTFSPPVDIMGAELSDFGAFSQQITVDHVQADNLDQIDTGGTSDFVRVTVTVTKNGAPISSTSWIRARLN